MSKDINPNSRSPFVDTRGSLSKYGMDVILKLYRALDFTGDSTLLDDIPSRGLVFAANESDIEEYIYVEVTSNYTTHRNSFLNVTAQCVITLNDNPEDGEQVVVHKNTGSDLIDIDVTDGIGTDRFIVDQSVLSYRYSIELNQWVRGG